MNTKLIQIWLNPSWRGLHIKRGFPDGYSVRIGRLMIRLFGTKV